MFAYAGMSIITLGILKIEITVYFGIDTSKLQYFIIFFSISSMLSILAS
jgi:hypothetical protein